MGVISCDSEPSTPDMGRHELAHHTTHLAQNADLQAKQLIVVVLSY